MPELSGASLFMILAGVVLLAAAIYAVTLGRLIRAAFALIFCLATLGIIYIALGNDFLGAIQILLYTGAIAVLVLFVVMLTRRSGDREHVAETKEDWGWGGALAGGLFILLFVALSQYSGFASAPSSDLPVGGKVIQIFGQLFAHEYFFPMQIAGILLTVAFIGAALIVRSEKKASVPAKTEESAS